MKLNEYQKLAVRTAKVYNLTTLGSTNMNLIHSALGVAGEAGELVDAIKKTVIYDKTLDIENVKEEIGDIFWYLALLAQTLDLDFDQILEDNINKLQLRYPDKYSDHHASARLDKQGE